MVSQLHSTAFDDCRFFAQATDSLMTSTTWFPTRPPNRTAFLWMWRCTVSYPLYRGTRFNGEQRRPVGLQPVWSKAIRIGTRGQHIGCAPSMYLLREAIRDLKS